MKSSLWFTLSIALIVASTLIAGTILRRHVPLAPEVPSPPQAATTNIPTHDSLPLAKSAYIEVVDSCGPLYDSACLNVRTGPGTHFPSVGKLRTGMVLAVGDVIRNEDVLWYKIKFDEWVRYPERISEDWYVSGEFVRYFETAGPKELSGTPHTTKRIIIDRSEQKLYAYDGEQIVMEELVSSGLDDTPTPRGEFRVFRKTPARYMQGPLPDISDDYYDLPGVPWNLYFTVEGGAIHGAYWHNEFGQPHSHGCVNLALAAAKRLYDWADLGTPVIVRD